MKELDARAFARLFDEAYRKCFADSFTSPLTESESHHFSVEISESTGREIGWKSLKNYSHYLLGKPQGKPENPSNQTLDALARYVASAPASDAEQRPNGKRHYPYWFRYREAFHQSQPSSTDARNVARSQRSIVLLAVTLAIALAGVLIVLAGRGKGTDTPFVDEFDSLADVALAARGWSLLSMDTAHWSQRGAKPGHLTLYTLTGDNWPHAGTVPGIKNLLVRDAPLDCFGAEVRLTSFFPKHDWQQAGVILLEDTAFVGKSIRLSIGYNDFAGGFPATREVLIQAVTSLGRSFSNPEEIAHQRLFIVDPGNERLVGENLEQTALRIERRGHRYRLLYAVGPMKNAPFKEVVSTDFDMRPRYIGIFALKGFVPQTEEMPVFVDAFTLTHTTCSD